MPRRKSFAPDCHLRRCKYPSLHKDTAAGITARTRSCSRARRRPGRRRQRSSRRPRPSGRSSSRCRARPLLHWGRSAQPAMQKPYITRSLTAMHEVTVSMYGNSAGPPTKAGMQHLCMVTETPAHIILLDVAALPLANRQSPARNQPFALPLSCAPRSARRRSQARTRTRRRRRIRRGRSTHLRCSANLLRTPPPAPSSAAWLWATLLCRPRAVRALRCRR